MLECGSLHFLSVFGCLLHGLLLGLGDYLGIYFYLVSVGHLGATYVEACYIGLLYIDTDSGHIILNSFLILSLILLLLVHPLNLIF